MAIQSSYYTTDGTTRTYPSSKHIASKLHVAVYFQTALTSAWSIVESSQYELVNNSIVFYTAPVESIYSQIEIRVADTTAELEDSPSDIAIVAGAITDVINVSNNMTVVENVNNHMGAVTTVSANITNLNSIVSDVIPNLPEILLADDNAAIATASATLAQGYANSIVPSSFVKNVATIADLATINPTTIGVDNVFVKDLDRGGLFVWSSTGTANGGTVFAGLTGYWNRQYSEAINVKWFGAKGDGVTDDSEVFTYLGTLFTNIRIDLCGLEYYVTSVPSENLYYNGVFLVNKTTTIAGISYSYTYKAPAILQSASSSTDMLSSLRVSNAVNQFTLTQDSNPIQGHCFDEVAKRIYILHLEGTGDSEVSFISQYVMDSTQPQSPSGTSLSSSQLGHQGLSLEVINNASPKLWGSVRYNSTNYPLSGRQAIRFNYDSDGTSITNIQEFTLFGSEFSYKTNATLPSISYDQRFLIAVGRKTSRDFYVRVFDLKLLVEGGSGDYSSRYLFEWNIDAEILRDDSLGAFTPIQALACDGQLVYILAGNAGLSNKRIHAYTLEGSKAFKNDSFSVGLSQATSDGGNFYEPESLAFYKAGASAPTTLSVMILSQVGSNFVNRIWALNSSASQTYNSIAPYSGTWTPTISEVTTTNTTSVTAYECNYMRVGNVVSVSGRLAADAITTGAVELTMSLPFSVDFTSITQAAGVAWTQTAGQNGGGSFIANTASDTLLFKLYVSSTANTAYSFSGMYRID